MTDICIIGGGTAGLTAAIYGLRAGKSVTILEALSYGGQIVNSEAIENYPGIKKISGFEFSTALYEQAMDLGLSFEYDKCTRIEKKKHSFIVYGTVKSYEAKSVIVATGAKRKKINVPGENELTGCGVSYCATCDGAFYRGRDVAVCGGGNTAVDEAYSLSNICNSVTLIHRRDEFRASNQKLDAVRDKDNINIITNASIKSINGDDAVSSITVEDKGTGKSKDIDVAGVFIAVGQEPDSSLICDMLKRDDTGYYISTEQCTTEAEGLYVAGDCRSKEVRQLTTAAADGTIAAIEACKYIDNL